MTDIKKPSVGHSLAGEITEGFDNSDKLSARLDRYYKQKKRALVNYDHLSDLLENEDFAVTSFMESLDYLKNNPLYEITSERHLKIISHFQKINSKVNPSAAFIDASSVDPTFEGYTKLAKFLLSDFSRYKKSAYRIKGCGNYLVFHQYFTVGKTRLAKASFCKQHLICPLCAIRRGAKTLQTYTDRYLQVKEENPSYRLSMLTLTVKNGDDLSERFQHLKKSCKVLFDRRRDWVKKGRGKTEFRKIHGWLGTFEITKDGAKDGSKSGWHPHAHIMILHTENIDYRSLRKEWKEVTGDSHILNISAAQHPDDPVQDFMEVCKYALKFGDLTPGENIHAWNVLRGKHLLFSGGCLYGVKVPDKMEDDLLSDLPYIELFYKANLTSYQLESSLMKDPEIKDIEILSFGRVTLDYLSSRVANKKVKRKKVKSFVSNQSDFKLGYEAYSENEQPPKGKRIQFYKGWNKHKSEVKNLEKNYSGLSGPERSEVTDCQPDYSVVSRPRDANLDFKLGGCRGSPPTDNLDHDI